MINANDKQIHVTSNVALCYNDNEITSRYNKTLSLKNAKYIKCSLTDGHTT